MRPPLGERLAAERRPSLLPDHALLDQVGTISHQGEVGRGGVVVFGQSSWEMNDEIADCRSDPRR
jgi:hypothetical protein